MVFALVTASTVIFTSTARCVIGCFIRSDVFKHGVKLCKPFAEQSESGRNENTGTNEALLVIIRNPSWGD